MIRPMTWKLLPRYWPSVQRLIGEGSGGRSATLPTLRRFRSSRTRIDLQKGQTVWTALDQRNWTRAPQLGQLAWGALIRVPPLAGSAFRDGGFLRKLLRSFAEGRLQSATQ